MLTALSLAVKLTGPTRRHPQHKEPLVVYRVNPRPRAGTGGAL